MKLRKLVRYFAIPVLAFSLPLFSGVGNVGQLNRNNDKGFWLQEEFIGDISKNAYINVAFEQRWGNNYRTFWYHHYQVIGQYDFAPWIKESLCLCCDTPFKTLTFGPGFKEAVFIRRNSHFDNVWASANIPMLEANLTIELPVLGGLFRQRYRGEYVSFNTKHFHDHGLFRYRMYYFTPWRLGRVEFNPWVSNEFFFRQTTRRGGAIIQQGNWYENRFRIGANARLTKNLFIDLYWQWRTVRQLPGFYPNWANTYQIGVNSIYMF